VDRRTGVVSRQHAGESVQAWRQCASFEVEIASGAAMLVRHEVCEQIGLMDEDFFLYFEEVDWCLKVRRAGYRIRAVPQSLVWHDVSATLGPTCPVIDYYMLRNRLRFIARHWTGAARVRLLGRTMGRNLLTIAAYTIKSDGGRRRPHRDARLLALRDATLGRWGEMGPDVAARIDRS
jgi:GT2 family glycosyltransferase